MKKAFTLVEILFVMVIISILVGFAISNLKDTSKDKRINSMKNDAKNAIEKQFEFFRTNQKHDEIKGDFDDSVNGILISKNGTEFSISKGNSLKTEGIGCEDGTLGFTVEVINDIFLANYYITFNSCTDGTIQSHEGE